MATATSDYSKKTPCLLRIASTTFALRKPWLQSVSIAIAVPGPPARNGEKRLTITEERAGEKLSSIRGLSIPVYRSSRSSSISSSSCPSMRRSWPRASSPPGLSLLLLSWLLLCKTPEVVSVFLTRGKKVHTTHSSDFLSLEQHGKIPHARNLDTANSSPIPNLC